MSRHRNIRNVNFYEEDDGYDEDLAHSVDDEYGVSPATMAEYMYDRSNAPALKWSQSQEPPLEEDEDETEVLHNCGSSSSLKANLNDIELAKLNSCLDEVRSVVGETVPESAMEEVCIECQFDIHRTLDRILAMQEAPKPQRGQRQRNRGASTDTTQAPVLDALNPLLTAEAPNGTVSGRIKFTTEDVDNASLASKTDTPKAPKTHTNSRVVDKSSEKGARTAADRAGLKGPLSSRPPPTESKGPLPSKASRPSSDKHGPLADRPAAPVVDEPVHIEGLGAAGGGPDGEGSVHKNLSYTDLPHLNACGGPEAMHRNMTVSDFRLVEPATPTRASGKTKATAAALAAEYEARKTSGKDHINLVVIGHVDAGKSTLMGHVLYQLGVVSKRTMHKYEQETRKIGKASFAFAWILDETEEERARGVTMDVAQTWFETDSKRVMLLDAPGHKDFIPNMITGAAQADVAILVVNTTKGEFETGFETGGQTREHTMLVRSLGVTQLLVAVNKMDTVNWSQDRFQEVVNKLTPFLKQTGFKDFTFIPCSGLEGDNLISPVTTANAAWYKGPTLVQQIDRFQATERLVSKPLRLCISDVFKSIGAGFSLAGTIQAGAVQPGDRVTIMPVGVGANVKSVTIDEVPMTSAFAGDNVVVTVTGINPTDVAIGSIICDPAEPILSTTRIRARIVVFNINVPITKGFPVVFHYQSLTVSAVIKHLVSQLNKASGEVIKKKPRCLTKNSSAVVDIDLDSPVCVELYKDYKDLGRFMLRYAGTTIAAGLVIEIRSSKGEKNE